MDSKLRGIVCWTILALVATALVAVAGVTRVGAQVPRSVDAQAKALAAHARQAAPEIMPTWTAEETDYVARSVELAVLQASDAPLSEEMFLALKSAVTYYLKSNYRRPARETLEYHRDVLAWRFADIVATGMPDPEEVAALRGQLRELLAWLRERMKAELSLDEDIIEEALSKAEERWVDDNMDELSCRFDRRPLSPEAMEGAKRLLEGRITEAKERLEKIRPRDWWPPGMTKFQFGVEADRVTTAGLYAVIKEYGGWRVLPEALEQKLRASGAAQRAASEGWSVGDALETVRLVLAAVLAEEAQPGASVLVSSALAADVGNPPGLSEAERSLVEQLCGPAAVVHGVAYDARIAMPTRGGPTTTIGVQCRIRGASVEARIKDKSGPEPAYGFLLCAPGMGYRLSPGRAEVLQGDTVWATYDRQSPTGPEGHVLRSVPTLGSFLLTAASRLDLKALSWRPFKTPPQGDRFYEARRREPPQMPARVVDYRFAFDPTAPCVRRAVGLGGDGTRVAETSFDEARRTPDGQSVPLRGVTQVAAGTEVWRVAMGDGQVGETKVPRPAYTVTTEYEWSEQERVRFPRTRTIRAADGAALGEIRFSNYQVLDGP